MSSQIKNKALFLDRDGTLNIEKKYVFKIEDFEFTDGIVELIKSYQDQNFLIIIVSNQSGIARGYYSENDYQILTKWMINKLKTYGINVAKVYHCPHHPDYTGECDCRKPKPGMILKAIHEFNINPSESVLIGDKKSDILAGQNAGIAKNIFIQRLLEK